MFVVVEQVMDNGEIKGYSGYIVDKKLQGNVIQCSKTYITLEVAKKLADNHRLRSFIKHKEGCSIERFTNFGNLILGRKGLLSARCVLDFDFIFNNKSTGIEAFKEGNKLMEVQYTEDMSLVFDINKLGVFGYLANKLDTDKLFEDTVLSHIHLYCDLLKRVGYELVKSENMCEVKNVELENSSDNCKYSKLELKAIKKYAYGVDYTLKGIDRLDGACETLIDFADSDKLLEALAKLL